jgi:hypothetical protein
MTANTELEPFAKFIEALDPWLDQVVLIGGWTHRLYRLHPHAQDLPYPVLTTLDGDVAVPEKLLVKGLNIRVRLLEAAFAKNFSGKIAPRPRTTRRKAPLLSIPILQGLLSGGMSQSYEMAGGFVSAGRCSCFNEIHILLSARTGNSSPDSFPRALGSWPSSKWVSGRGETQAVFHQYLPRCSAQPRLPAV